MEELNWRKTMQDTFSHNKGYFSSGKKVFGRTGFWRISDKAPLQNILKEANRISVERVTKLEKSIAAIGNSIMEIPPEAPTAVPSCSVPAQKEPESNHSLNLLLDAICLLEGR